jgi:predicted Zn-ribbon and HTH transcriptional regulator
MSRPRSLKEIRQRLAELGQPVTLKELRERAKRQRQMVCRAWYSCICRNCGREWEAAAGTVAKCPDCRSGTSSYRLYRIVEHYRDGAESEFVNVEGIWQRVSGVWPG